ncbi:MAG: HAD family hydrolase [Opitutales bacterium]
MPTKSAKNLLEVIQALSSPMEPEPTAQEAKLQKLDDIGAVIFDVYGTLFQSGVGDISLSDKGAIDREAAIRDAFEAAGFRLTDSGINPLATLFGETLAAHQDIRRGDDVDNPEVDVLQVWEDYLDQLAAFEVFEGAVTPHSTKAVAVHFECRVNPVWPMPGMQDCLAALRQREVPLSIISNAQFFTPLLFPALLDQPLGSLGFAEKACVWSYELRRAKPSLSLFETSAEYFEKQDGLKPQDILYVGNDMLNDIYPASHIGFRTALFAGDLRSLRLREDRPECAEVKPDLVLTQLDQLVGCLF